MVLVLPTHAFGDPIIETSKSHHLLTYSHNIQIIHILVHWKPLENGDKTHKIFCHFNNSK